IFYDRSCLMAKKVAKYSLVAFLSGTFIFDKIGFPSTVKGSSMEPTLKGIDSKDSFLTIQDVVWVNRLKKNPEKLDTIVFISPTNRHDMMIKRVIGVEGERVRFPKINDGKYFLIPKNYFCVGSDNINKNIVKDSSSFGAIPNGLIIGKATHIIWPPNRWRKLI
uniref:Mitochondrial inner membrane protease subunit 2 n=2 Tax=Strongyloides stercoralis TaxID=6248 RepID=A0AAF5D226_STRER